MRETRTLRLRKERLAELTTGEMGGVVGGTHLGCLVVTDACTHGACGTQTILPFRTCVAFCVSDPRICTTQ